MGEHRSGRARGGGAQSRENLTGLLFVTPALLIIGVFGIFPVFFTVYVSLFKWRIRKGGFLGLANYAEIFGSSLHLLLTVVGIAALLLAVFVLTKERPARVKRPRGPLAAAALLIAAGVALLVVAVPTLWSKGDPEVFDSLRVTVWYSVGTVPLQLAVGLLLALVLAEKLPARQFFRVVYLLPYIVPAVASAAVFERIFSLRPESFANQVVALFHLPAQQWLREPKGIFLLLSGGRIPTTSASVIGTYWLGWAQGPSLALFSIMIYNWWVFVGYYALIYANGFAAIPRELTEAAEVDGASRRAIFFRITLPLLSPTTYFLTLLGVIGTFKAFTHIYVLRNPAASGAVDPLSVQIFFTFFRNSRFGYAAAISLVLFAIVMVLTVLQRRGMEKRISYGD